MSIKNEIKQENGLLYKGIIKGNEKSNATLAFYGVAVIAIFNDGGKTFELSKHKDDYLMYALSPEPDLLVKCGVEDDGIAYTTGQLSSIANTESVYNKCIKISVDVEHDIVVDKGNAFFAQIYINNLFNQVAALFAQDSINISIGAMNVWGITASPYSGNDVSTVLSKFSTAQENNENDLAFLLSYKFSEGKAMKIGGLCNENKSLACAYAKIESSFNYLPTYSSSVNIIAHELGHLLGSRHTHACVWNGNGTPIDGCYSPEGKCDAPEPPEDGGSIMSYCHLSNVGIDFSKGFTEQPRNVIHNKILESTCLSICENIPCYDNSFSFIMKTDENGLNSFWEITTDENVLVDNGFPKIAFTENHFPLCLKDGCYKLKVHDLLCNNPCGIMDISNSKIIIDGNDGTTSGSTSLVHFGIYSPRFRMKNIDLKILDPQLSLSPNFAFIVEDHGIYKFDGKLTTGGGDETTSTNHLGYVINSQDLRIDTLHVKGGLYTENKHTRNGGNLNWVGQLKVDPSCEYGGRVAVDKNVLNNGYISIGQNDSEFLAIGGEADIAHQYINANGRQSISGNGFFKLKFTDPYITNQQSNKIGKLICNNAKGIDLNLPLNVHYEMILRRGTIKTSLTNLLSMGSVDHNAELFSDTLDELLLAPTFDTIKYFHNWNGGVIDGPFKRYYHGKTKPAHSIMPLGNQTSKHRIAFNFVNSAPGYLIGEYKAQDPGSNGLAFYGEQGINVIYASPTGYWHIDSSGVSGKYNVHVNANNFKESSGNTITNVDKVRVIKRHGTHWQPTNPTTPGTPISLSNITLYNLTTFSDFGLGIGLDTSSHCGLWVYNSIDNQKGSLRYILDSCAVDGNTIKIVASVDTVFLNLDSLLINKNITIIGTDTYNPTVLKGKIGKKVVEIPASKTVALSELKLLSNSPLAIPALKNSGTLTLNNVIIKDSNGKGKLINTAILTVQNQVKLE